MDDRYFTESDLGHGALRGENGRLQWRLTKEGCLIIHGCGALSREVEYEVNHGDGWDGHYSTSEKEWPWVELMQQVRKIIIGEGITKICYKAFSDYGNVNEIELPETLQEIGSSAFSGTSISRIRIPESVKTIDGWAFAKTRLPKDGDEFYVDGWLITYTGTNMPQYSVRPGTRGIARLAFNWCTLEDLFIPGTVKNIGSSSIKGLNRVYLGKECPWITGELFRDMGDRFSKSPEIIRRKTSIPTEFGESTWSFAHFAETEKTYDKARAHQNSDRLQDVLNFLKNGALEEAVAHCSMHITSKGSLTPEEYVRWGMQLKEYDVWNLSNWGLGKFEADASSRTIYVLFAPQKGVMCSVALAVLNRLEMLEETATGKSVSFDMKCQIPDDLQRQDGFLALNELVESLYPWIRSFSVIISNEVSTYSKCYTPLKERLSTSGYNKPPAEKGNNTKSGLWARLFVEKK